MVRRSTRGASMSSTRWSRRRFQVVVRIGILMSAAACSLPPASTTRTTPTVTPSAEVGQHRITVRTVESQAEFYDVATGRAFTPRGVNLINLVRGEDGQLQDR